MQNEEQQYKEELKREMDWAFDRAVEARKYAQETSARYIPLVSTTSHLWAESRNAWIEVSKANHYFVVCKCLYEKQQSACSSLMTDV